MKPSQCKHRKRNASQSVLTLTASLKKRTTKRLQKAWMNLKPPFISRPEQKENFVVYFQQYGRVLCNFSALSSVLESNIHTTLSRLSRHVITTVSTIISQHITISCTYIPHVKFVPTCTKVSHA